jgi:hypothetical protein
MLWVDPTDPEVFAAVVGPDPDQGDEEMQDLVTQAVAIASELLTLATGFRVHPDGETTEECQAARLTRLSPLYTPVISVTSLVRVLHDGSEQPVTYRQVGNALQVHDPASYGMGVPLWRTNWAPLQHRQRIYRFTYRYGSTVSPTARAMLLDYAKQFYLWLIEDDECALPENVTSIDREGLGIQLATPQDFLDKGRTGLAKIDTWLSQINSSHATRPSAVYTPDMPPGVPVRRGGVG